MSSPSLPASVATIILSDWSNTSLITFSCFNAPGSALYPFSAFTCRGGVISSKDIAFFDHFMGCHLEFSKHRLSEQCTLKLLKIMVKKILSS